jgi:hypothetical protein
MLAPPEVVLAIAVRGQMQADAGNGSASAPAAKRSPGRRRTAPSKDPV